MVKNLDFIMQYVTKVQQLNMESSGHDRVEVVYFIGNQYWVIDRPFSGHLKIKVGTLVLVGLMVEE